MADRRVRRPLLGAEDGRAVAAALKAPPSTSRRMWRCTRHAGTAADGAAASWCSFYREDEDADELLGGVAARPTAAIPCAPRVKFRLVSFLWVPHTRAKPSPAAPTGFVGHSDAQHSCFFCSAAFQSWHLPPQRLAEKEKAKITEDKRLQILKPRLRPKPLWLL